MMRLFGATVLKHKLYQPGLAPVLDTQNENFVVYNSNFYF